ncbi:MAG: NAD(P)H-dependent oxidoreductase [Thioalkalispiraceae bacterium]|jgi:putative NADPH-quinone reductase
MTTHITLIQGHPDPTTNHFGHALANAYQQAALEAGHQVKVINIAELDFPLLRSQQDWLDGELPVALQPAQQAIGWADHLLIFYPLWLGAPPAILKAFFEQVLRPGFAIELKNNGKGWHKRLTGKSARIVVTMGMPAWFYRCYFRAHSLKNLERNILGLCGIAPIKSNLFGLIENRSEKQRNKWLNQMRALGQAAA